MTVYGHKAAKAEKLVLDLGVARDRVLLASNIYQCAILDKGVGTWTLHFIFYDGTEVAITNGEVANGDVFWWTASELRLSNTAQSGQTLKLLVSYMPVEGEAKTEG